MRLDTIFIHVAVNGLAAARERAGLGAVGAGGPNATKRAAALTQLLDPGAQ